VLPPEGAAPSEVLPPEHIALSTPATAAGNELNVTFTSSVDAVHVAFEIVQRNVYAVPATPVNVDVGLVGVVTVPPAPEVIVQAPVPIAGVLAARVTMVNPHVDAPVWSGPALDVVGLRLNVTLTSSVDAVHVAFEIVQRNVYAVPATPVNVDVGLVGVVTVPPAPEVIVQAPVPIAGVLAARVTVVNPHVDAPVWSGPALDVVGLRLNVTFTSSVDAAHGAFEIVQRNVYAVPATPVNVDVGLVGVVTVPPAPEVIVQAPVPVAGVLAARVTVLNPHVDAPVWSGPALDVVGF